VLQEVAREAEATFGGLDARQLNWRPDATGWSVAQCLQHLLTANGFMLRNAKHALQNPTQSMWRRVPLLPGLMGRAMIRSQSPTTTRKFTAPTTARPSASEIPGEVVQRFIEQQRDIAEWTRTIDEAAAAGAIMVSPFVRIVAYSVLDACRLLVAHDRRHVGQAGRVLLSPQFPV
jgi:uncharacterized damage-inducible protein DinB